LGLLVKYPSLESLKLGNDDIHHSIAVSLVSKYLRTAHGKPERNAGKLWMEFSSLENA